MYACVCLCDCKKYTNTKTCCAATAIKCFYVNQKLTGMSPDLEMGPMV